MPDRILPATPQRSIRHALKHLGRGRRWCLPFRLRLPGPCHPHPHQIACPVLQKQPSHIENGIRPARRLDLACHRLDRPRIRHETRFPALKGRRALPEWGTRPTVMLLPLRTRPPLPSSEFPAVPRRTISPRRPLRPWPPAFSLRTRPAVLLPLRTRSTWPTRTRPSTIPSTRSPAVIPRPPPPTAIVLPALPPQYLRRNLAPHHFSRLFPGQILDPVRPELEILQLRQINGVRLAHDGNQLDNVGSETFPGTQGARSYRNPLLNQSQLSPIRGTPGRTRHMLPPHPHSQPAPCRSRVSFICRSSCPR